MPQPPRPNRIRKNIPTWLRLTPALALVTLTACGPLSTWYKPGGTVARMESDLTDCQVSALNKVPRQMVTGVTPIVWVPVRHCDRHGKNCVTEYEMEGGHPYSYDANQSLRGRVAAQCMGRKGYAMTQIPACPESTRKATPAARTVTMPKLRDTSCVIRNRDGSWQVVNQTG